MYTWTRRLRRILPKREEPEAMDWIIAGLGNPGPRFEGSRHNIGKDVVHTLSERWLLPLDQSKFKARFGTGRPAGPGSELKVCLLTPLSFMNLSGEAVVPLAQFYKVPPERVLIIYDEMDLPLGHLRLRPDGGPGGHNGMRSLIKHFGSEAFPRLRFGIGRPPEGWRGADFVLAQFQKAEHEVVEETVQDAVEVIEDLLRLGIDGAMNRHNRRAR